MKRNMKGNPGSKSQDFQVGEGWRFKDKGQKCTVITSGLWYRCKT
jgi:hypothetical protein